MENTGKVYGFLWSKNSGGFPRRWHFHDVQSVVPEPMVRGKRGLEIGSGCGYDTLIMARDNPEVKILGFDMSGGVFKTKEITGGLSNVWLMQASALGIPLKDDLFDFAYSYGVLHHTPDPEGALREIRRVLKKEAPVFLYLYEDHSDNPVKYFILKIVNILRRVTTKMPVKLLYYFSYLVSPFAVIFFTFPAKLFAKFNRAGTFSKKIPFNYGTHLFSLAADLYDRFGAPIEHRFSKKNIFHLLNNNGFIKINICKIKSKAGWVAWGYKN